MRCGQPYTPTRSGPPTADASGGVDSRKLHPEPGRRQHDEERRRQHDREKRRRCSASDGAQTVDLMGRRRSRGDACTIIEPYQLHPHLFHQTLHLYDGPSKWPPAGALDDFMYYSLKPRRHLVRPPVVGSGEIRRPGGGMRARGANQQFCETGDPCPDVICSLDRNIDSLLRFFYGLFVLFVFVWRASFLCFHVQFMFHFKLH